MDFRELLEEKSKKILNGGAEELCEQFNLSKNTWVEKLVYLAQRAAVETKMEVLVNDGSKEKRE
jgi:hypothetical protein